jgi:H+/Cl- antiporter ClcA
MAAVSSETGRHASDRRSRWVIALAATSLVAVTAFAFAVHQFVLKYLYDQSSYTRTPGGVLMILFAFAGVCRPIALYRNRPRFRSLRLSRQWRLAMGIPLVHVLVLVVCWEASHRSGTIILLRPFTPTAVVLYRPGDSRVEFWGRLEAERRYCRIQRCGSLTGRQ